MNRFVMGVDLGQVSDPSAICLLDERIETRNLQSREDTKLGALGDELVGRHYLLRLLERPPLGTAYPSIVRQVLEGVNHPAVAGNIDLVVDATGVGRPVVDIMRENGLNPIPVIITFGQGGKDIVVGEDGYFRVPKVDIMSSLQVLFGSHLLKYPDSLPDLEGVNLVPVWLQEMERFRMKRTASGNMTYEAWRETDHDDIVLAIAITCWWVLYSRPKTERSPLAVDQEEPYNPHKYRSVLRR